MQPTPARLCSNVKMRNGKLLGAALSGPTLDLRGEGLGSLFNESSEVLRAEALLAERASQLVNREPDLTVCADADESNAALDAVENLRPDLAIVDISLSSRDCLELLKMIRAKDSLMPVLILSMHGEITCAERARSWSPSAASVPSAHR